MKTLQLEIIFIFFEKFFIRKMKNLEIKKRKKYKLNAKKLK